jgi:hypothetical protein
MKSRERSRGKEVKGKKSKENSRAVHELAYATGFHIFEQNDGQPKIFIEILGAS